MRFFSPIILIIISIGSFFWYTYPTYKSLDTISGDQTSINRAIENAIKYRTVQENLSSSYRSISSDDVSRLKMMIPDTLDNVRLVIDLEKVANQSGMVFSKVQYDTAPTQSNLNRPTTPHGSVPIEQSVNDKSNATLYGTASITFTVAGTYEQFVGFMQNLEKSLRLIDVTSIGFSASDVSNNSSKDKKVAIDTNPVYDYAITIKTYWLKN